LFSGLRGALRPLLTSPAVELLFDIPDKVPNLFTDEAKVTQILRNLISNALKFTEQGEVRVTASFDAEKKRVNLSVRDTGIGIAPQDLGRIFEEFSQVETKIQKRVKGTGLGLPLSKSLAELLGGELTVESVLGQGSVFKLSIPPERGDPLRAQRAADNARKRVLLIDDDETFRYVMRQIISSEPRYEFIEAVDGDVGLKAAREQKPDVIILDLQMPTMDGFSVLQELNADSRTSVTPVIVSTSLNVNAELKARLPAGTRVISKNTISRENVSLFLRDATVGAS
jgi:CheY-like chemotaxis protein/anti-sigma regulatory factor (Ser/Thr protein kinase)